jgi:hypothetical protein
MTVESAPAFTVLLPVNRSPELLGFAIASVLEQRRRDFELIVICDGAPPATAALARRFLEDPRVRVKVHPKGPNRGEIWRHEALGEARGQFVCQLGDDDLWLPEHLDEMAALLETVDFGHTLHVEHRADGSMQPHVGNLAIARTREQMLTMRVNLSGPTCAGYRLAAYRSLPEGWAPPREEIWSDLHMWRKFLRHPGLTFATRYAVTAVCLPNALRRDWPMERRVAETALLAPRLRDPAWRADYRARALALAAERLGIMLARSVEETQALAPLREQARELQEQLAQARADAARLQEEAGSARAEIERLTRRLRRAEAHQDYVERSRVWRLRQRLARLLGRP